MKCNHCNSEWNVPEEIAAVIQICPFCHKPISKDPVSKATALEREKETAADCEIENGVLLKYNGSAKRVDIPGSVTEIGEDAFAENEEIEEVYIGRGVQIINSAAFNECSNLRKVVLPVGLVEIRDWAFSDTAIREISIPSGVRVIGEGAFSGTELKNVSIPGSVEKLERQAFEYCYYLRDVILENGLKEIEECAFGGCHKLEWVIFPETIQTIDESAFENSSSIKTIIIHNSLAFLDQHWDVIEKSLETDPVYAPDDWKTDHHELVRFFEGLISEQASPSSPVDDDVWYAVNNCMKLSDVDNK